MPRSRLADFGSIWKTIRELDVLAIRREAEHDVLVTCVGDRAALDHVHRLLLEGPDRYGGSASGAGLNGAGVGGAWGPAAGGHAPVGSALALVRADQVEARARLIADADLLVVALDSRAAVGADELAGLELLVDMRRPRQLLVVFGDESFLATPWLARVDARQTSVIEPHAAKAAEQLARAVFDALPGELHLAAARRLPGLRPLLARRLTAEVSLSNGAFALASGVPALVPVLGIPITAADTLVLTKNQALLVYRLALAYGAPPDFQKRMLEITPVIGAAVMWRQVAAGLVGLVPGYGIVPKTAVAYAGTYITGRAAALWYETGIVSQGDLRRISREASQRAKAVATEMVQQARAASGKAGKGAGAVREKTKGAREKAKGAREKARSATARARSGGAKAVKGARNASQRVRGASQRVRGGASAARPEALPQTPPLPPEPPPDAPSEPPPDAPSEPPPAS